MQWDMLTQQEPSDADSDAVGRNLRVNQSRFAAHSAAQPGEGSQQASGISPNVSTARTDDELGSKLHRDQGKLVSRAPDLHQRLLPGHYTVLRRC